MYNNSAQLQGGLPNSLTPPTFPSETTLLPLYHTSLGCANPTTPNINNKTESGLTFINNNVLCDVGIIASKKRNREDPLTDLEALTASQKTKFCSGQLSSFAHDDVVFPFHQQQQQLEIDRFISQHNQKVRMEVEERRRRQSKMLVMSLLQEGGVIHKLKEKDQQLQRMGEFNWALQEKVKSLCLENQALRDLAQSNEATANSLRRNLEQLLAHVSGGGWPPADDAESSCCGSSGPHGGEDAEEHNNKGSSVRACKKCGERETSVLVLPCRHLCLCTVCGSTCVSTCPVCDSAITASVHVNMS